MYKWVTLSAAVLSGALFASPAGAITKDLTGVDAQGNAISSGWSYTISDALASSVNLVFIRSSGSNFYFEKDAVVTNASTPIVIDFTKTGTNAQTLVINDEAVANQSGQDWTGFRFDVSGGNGGAPAFALTATPAASGIGDFRIDPFTQFAFSNSNSVLDLSGGTVKAGDSWFPGAKSTTGLAITANGTTSNFSLVEQALTTGGGPPVAIPLPAAAWTGLSGLAGLALLKKVKRAR